MAINCSWTRTEKHCITFDQIVLHDKLLHLTAMFIARL